MSETTPKREFAVDVVRQLQEAGYTALWAGGCVRDSLLGLTPEDYDVATNARPEQVQQLFGPRRTRAIGASFGVILVHSSRRQGTGDVEVATFRTEGPYRDGRRPESVAFCTPEEDAQRRDFTINGMFFDPIADRVLDFVGGQEDLQRRVVRAIGDPHARFREDKLRMLRAVRITARFDFQLEDVTARAVREMASEILIVSQERIAQELKKMLVHPRRARAVALARDLQLLTVILPEMSGLVANTANSSTADRYIITLRRLELLDAPGFEPAMAALLHDVVPTEAPAKATEVVQLACRRLRLSNREIDHIAWLVSNRHALREAPTMRISRLKRLFADPLHADLLSLARAETMAAGTDLAPVEFCENYLRATPSEEINPPPLLTGDDLIRHGLKPGEKFKEILEAVRDAQLEGQVKTADEALKMAEDHL